VDAPGNDGNVSMPELVKRPNPWRKMMMMMNDLNVNQVFTLRKRVLNLVKYIAFFTTTKGLQLW
jgi:hypothetical protein